MQAPGWEYESETRNVSNCATLVRESVSIPDVEDVPYVGFENFE